MIALLKNLFKNPIKINLNTTKMSQYFSGSNRRGELQELKEELNSTDFERMKEAIKRVIALMTLGRDLSPLFHSVVKCLEINDILIKKLVYLYIINYSRSCLLYTSPSPRDRQKSRMPSSA